MRLVPDVPQTRIPHVGWNEVSPRVTSPLFEGIPSGKDFYFVHTFHFACERTEEVLATHAILWRVHVGDSGRPDAFGVQFHPEKSQRWGAAAAEFPGGLMLKTRVIPTLLYRASGLVKGTRFDSWRPVGAPCRR